MTGPHLTATLVLTDPSPTIIVRDDDTGDVVISYRAYPHDGRKGAEANFWATLAGNGHIIGPMTGDADTIRAAIV
jgi:hypothetical protein